ncbi:hypothetical protein JRO89_XS08G0000300 [Xanthoceras sorbifolium]|uniref:RNase H type-1 domain-containing protein n=1 Tax=Xanthoceras sorbifolium TaxID=99658 RepID=A0ABQ8HMU1_9ROSI|nr:hypothetical protein JRO89_XS08G0000300 [Xanthoceras sorbifolium]
MECLYMRGLHFLDNTSFFDFILHCKSTLQQSDFEDLITIIWRIWFRRNNFVHSKQLPSDDLVIVRWIPPIEGFSKLNFDVAIDLQNGRVGLGVVIRDQLGKVLLSSSSVIEGDFDPEAAEALALRFGLTLAAEAGIFHVQVESYSANLVKLINSYSLPRSEIGFILDDIRSLLNDETLKLVWIHEDVPTVLDSSDLAVAKKESSW